MPWLARDAACAVARARRAMWLRAVVALTRLLRAISWHRSDSGREVNRCGRSDAAARCGRIRCDCRPNELEELTPTSRFVYVNALMHSAWRRRGDANEHWHYLALPAEVANDNVTKLGL